MNISTEKNKGGLKGNKEIGAIAVVVVLHVASLALWGPHINLLWLIGYGIGAFCFLSLTTILLRRFRTPALVRRFGIINMLIGLVVASSIGAFWLYPLLQMPPSKRLAPAPFTNLFIGYLKKSQMGLALSMLSPELQAKVSAIELKTAWSKLDTPTAAVINWTLLNEEKYVKNSKNEPVIICSYRLNKSVDSPTIKLAATTRLSIGTCITKMEFGSIGFSRGD